jgi:hypothetical protein
VVGVKLAPAGGASPHATRLGDLNRQLPLGLVTTRRDTTAPPATSSAARRTSLPEAGLGHGAQVWMRVPAGASWWNTCKCGGSTKATGNWPPELEAT